MTSKFPSGRTTRLTLESMCMSPPGTKFTVTPLFWIKPPLDLHGVHGSASEVDVKIVNGTISLT
jgi:hypothetical protein